MDAVSQAEKYSELSDSDTGILLKNYAKQRNYSTGIVRIVFAIKQGIENHPFIKKVLGIPVFDKYLKEAVFRAETSLYQELFVNLSYVALKFGSGIYCHSIWFGSLAFYYLFAGSHAVLSDPLCKAYAFLDEAYESQKPFRVIKIGKLYRVPKEGFDQ